MQNLLSQISKCKLCQDELPLGARPVLIADQASKIIIAGQAPGLKVHQTGIPFNDASGKRLRYWLNIDEKSFYDVANFAIIPMGFCYPGRSKNGDCPPIKRCRETWHEQVLARLKKVQLILPIGLYAQAYYLKAERKQNLTETVRAFQSYLPKIIPLPHPSPRNNIWLKKNPWFERMVIPTLQSTVHHILSE